MPKFWWGGIVVGVSTVTLFPSRSDQDARLDFAYRITHGANAEQVMSHWRWARVGQDVFFAVYVIAGVLAFLGTRTPHDWLMWAMWPILATNWLWPLLAQRRVRRWVTEP